jgi:hypothetical protein
VNDGDKILHVFGHFLLTSYLKRKENVIYPLKAAKSSWSFSGPPRELSLCKIPFHQKAFHKYFVDLFKSI